MKKINKIVSFKDYFNKKYNTPEKRRKFEENYQKFVKKLRDDVMKETAQKIRKERLKIGLSQDELAAKINTTRSVICRIEAGEQNITFEYASKIASALGKEFVWEFKRKR